MSYRRTALALARFVVVACGLGSPLAYAQGIASNAEAPREGEEVKGDTKVVDIDEVERGVFVSVDYGPTLYLPLAGAGFVNLNPNTTVPASRLSVRVGFDIANNLAVDAFVLGGFQQGDISLDDVRNEKTTGDVAFIAPGAAVRFAFITTERVFAYVRAGAGYALWIPGSVVNPAAGAGAVVGSVHTDASIGVEYYTKLRHVSVGVEADFQALIAPMAFGISVYPTLKYTF
jgi:hypothetical protein